LRDKSIGLGLRFRFRFDFELKSVRESRSGSKEHLSGLQWSLYVHIHAFVFLHTQSNSNMLSTGTTTLLIFLKHTHNTLHTCWLQAFGQGKSISVK